jgi:hypothetical protein
MDVRLVCEGGLPQVRTRYVVEVVTTRGCATVGSFEEGDTPDAERLARACAIRTASALRCRITRD